MGGKSGVSKSLSKTFRYTHIELILEKVVTKKVAFSFKKIVLKSSLIRLPFPMLLSFWLSLMFSRVENEKFVPKNYLQKAQNLAFFPSPLF